MLTPAREIAPRRLGAGRFVGVIFLGIARPDGTYLGVPRGDSVVRHSDTLVLYTRAGVMADLDRRRRGIAGDSAHTDAVREQKAQAAKERDEVQATADRP